MALFHLTAKPEPYFEAEVILNTQNIGSSFETFELTTDASTRGKFARTHGPRISCTLYGPALNLPLIHILQQKKHRVDLIKHTNTKPEF